jgi:uncharacterized protein with GYD domain
MPQWIRLSRLTDEGTKKMREGQIQMVKDIRTLIQGEGGELAGAWVTMGRYDIISIIDAPDEQTMLNIDAAIAGLRIYHSETLPAIPIEDFVKAFAGSPTLNIFLESWLQGKGGAGSRRS